MSTPEAKVKNKIKQILKDYGAYQFSPQTGGYGRSGIPDIIASIKESLLRLSVKQALTNLLGYKKKNLEIFVQHVVTAWWSTKTA